MLKSIRKWLGLCDHRWKNIQTGKVLSHGSRTVGHYFIQQCEHCGKLKEVKF